LLFWGLAYPDRKTPQSFISDHTIRLKLKGVLSLGKPLLTIAFFFYGLLLALECEKGGVPA
jgi:hypothetical protein